MNALKTSPAHEDYLKALFKLAELTPDAPVSTSAVAERLNIAQASATAMLKKLGQEGLVHYERYQGARLTPAGAAIAVDMIRRHRIIETFLVRDLAVPLEEVDAEAEVLEHAFSSALIDRLWRHLGCPEFDPHGAPIPAPDEAPIERRDLVALTALALGERACIVRLAAQNAGQLKLLSKLGLVPGQSVTRAADSLAGSDVLLMTDNRPMLPVSMSLAETIWVVRTGGSGQSANAQ
ncbi:metal-dependent transcriptional regulator [Halothiobacillus sp. DCM-1]|uniref:metal-dependent transcriptional regulator n=1 Tax=Halothiobacillus sp. DCM-1 TaxID=3112558 RepID=UPI00324CBE3C